jgi:hypothetical protein
MALMIIMDPNKKSDDDDDENEVLASDEEGEEEEDEEQQPSADESDDLLNEMRPTPSGPGVHYANNRVLEFEQLTMSKTQVLKRLVLCIVMLNLTFVTWGLLQVRTWFDHGYFQNAFIEAPNRCSLSMAGWPSGTNAYKEVPSSHW